MRIRIVAFACGVFVCGVAAAEAQFARAAPVAPGEDFSVEVGGMLWSPESRLGLQTGEPIEGGGTPADLVGAFGIERRRVTEYKLTYKPGRQHRFRFSFLPVRYGQETTPDSPVVFGDTVFQAGEPATVNVRWEHWRFGYQYDLASTERALLGVILEARRSRVAADMTSGSQTQNADATVTIPGMGFIIRVYVQRSVSLSFEYAGFGLLGPIGGWFTDDDLDATTRDLDFYLTGNISRHIGLQGGYRRVRTDFLLEGLRQDLEVKGWYAGALVRF